MSIKYLFQLGIIAIIAVSCSKDKNGLAWYEASGPVKSIRTSGYNAVEKFGELSEGAVLYDDDVNTLIEFNKDGDVTELSKLDYKGNLLEKNISKYDSNGKIIGSTNYDGNGDEIGRSVYTYNEDDKIIKVVFYNKSGKVKSIQENEWKGNKQIKRIFTNEYEKGNYSEYEYDGSKLVRTVEYDKDGKKTGRYEEYENGDVSKINKFVNPKFTTSLSYNEKGLCSAIINGHLSSIGIYSLVDGVSRIYEYEFDDQGNWIKRVEREKDSKKATCIIVREIEYY